MQTCNMEPKLKIINLKPKRKLELEKIREDVLSEIKNINYDDIFIQLKDQVKNVHAAYLFSPVGVEVLADLCRVISSTPASLPCMSWKDLAGYLKLSAHQIGCIEVTVKSDPTEAVLKTFAQHRDSTLDTIVSALLSKKRYDALIEIKKGFIELERIARHEQIKRTEGIFNEVESVTHGKGTIDGILRPEHWSILPHQLPITLKIFPSVGKEKKDISIHNHITKSEGQLQTSSVVRKKKVKNFSKAVMLTFAADGEEIARKIAVHFRKPREKHLPIGVLLLEEHLDKVLENPEEFISHVFPQMNYVVPILTEGYFLALKGNTHHQGSSLSSIDSIYVKFIHDLMMKYYVQNNCRNNKFRCIIPDEQYLKIIDHKHMQIDPVLKVFLKATEVEQLACRILNISWKVNNFNRGA